jgi:hypothetical protein
MQNRYLRMALPWLAIVAAGVVAAVLRYGFIEPADIAHACEAPGGPGWCPVRMSVVRGFLTYGYGYIAMAGVALALFYPRRWTATLSAALGLFALEMYCYEAGALALLIGCLRLVRLQAAAAPGAQYGDGDQHIHASP